jgi:hypothetical protein
MIYSHNSSSQLIGLMLIGGPMFVFSGLRKLSERRLLQNTPRSKVRSAAMGLVELSGVAQPVEAPLIAPVSQRPCCWWHCRVQELRSNGRSSNWVTIQENTSQTLLYLQDETGRVLVDPTGAELHVLNTIQGLNAETRTLLAGTLNGWGINDLNWIGGGRLRVIEDMIADGAPLMVLGELISLSEPPTEREERFHRYVELVKKDPARMVEADVNKDGNIDVEEWDAFRSRLKEEFTAIESARHAQEPDEDRQRVQAPARGNFVIATQSSEELENSLKWWAPISMLGGIVASALGAWLALISGWSVVFIVGCVGLGFILSVCFKSKGDSIWRLWLS